MWPGMASGAGWALTLGVATMFGCWTSVAAALTVPARPRAAPPMMPAETIGRVAGEAAGVGVGVHFELLCLR
jgi:hypothetical protein